MNEQQTAFTLSPVYCLHNGAVVLEQGEGKVKIGLVDPDNSLLKLRLTHAVQGQVRVVKRSRMGRAEESSGTAEFVALSQEEFSRKVSGLFTPQKQIAGRSEQKLLVEPTDNEAEALLNGLLAGARNEGATDVHIEGTTIRFRIGGVLKRELCIDGGRAEQLVRRIKLLAKLNVSEKRHGQDGQFVYTDSSGAPVFVRVSCVPAVSVADGAAVGSVVLRILDTNRVPLELMKLGFTAPQIEVMKQFCTLPDGLVLICGPTGSGKSTTAGAMLETIRSLKNDSRKIVSLEDPPEYVLPGVTQIEIRSSSNMDFPEALRRTYRQDPDVIMIGEIRDELTAKTAVQAALTGHLVIATMHVGTISQAVLRLYDLGEDPKLVRAVLHGIIVQHLDEGKLEARIRVLEPQAGES